MQWHDWNFLNKKVKYATQRDARLDEIFSHMLSQNMGSKEAYAYFGNLNCNFLKELLGPFDDKIFKVLDGFEDGLSVEQVSMYAYRQYSLDQMEFMRQAFNAGIPIHAMEVFLQTSPTGHALLHRVMEYENNPDSLEVFEIQLEQKKASEKIPLNEKKVSLDTQIQTASTRAAESRPDDQANVKAKELEPDL